MRRGLHVGPVLASALLAAAIAAPARGARAQARTAAGQRCGFSFVHRVTRSAHRRGWNVRFGARIHCSQTTSRLELGGNLVSWGTINDCRQCGKGWYVTSALTKPSYKRTAGRRSLTVTGQYFERRRRRHKVWVTFAVQRVGSKLYGFHDSNRKKCLKQPGDFYSCDGFSRVFR